MLNLIDLLPFPHSIEVNNTSGQALMGTVRIFIGPTVDEGGQPIPFDEQRKLMIELDKFSQPCEYSAVFINSC